MIMVASTTLGVSTVRECYHEAGAFSQNGLATLSGLVLDEAFSQT
jgi:hypothetical protein